MEGKQVPLRIAAAAASRLIEINEKPSVRMIRKL
jgi:hypothetical protein